MTDSLISFISLSDYAPFIDVLKKKAKYLRSECVERHILVSDESLVIEKRKGHAQIVRRIGNPSDGVVEEIILTTQEEEFDKLRELFSTLGFSPCVIWKRQRDFYEWWPVLVQADFYEDFGCVVEFLLYGQLQEKEKTLKEAVEKFQELGLCRVSAKELKNLKEDFCQKTNKKRD